MRTAICPGSYDPITLGHLNVIRRAARLFDKVVVCVGVNAGKHALFTLEERMDHIRRVTARLGNVEVASWDGLQVDFAKNYENPVLVRGLRTITDFEYEFQMEMFNKRLNKDVETIFLAAAEKYTYLSSSAVRELALYGADLSSYVPYEILEEVAERGRAK
ncbi:MAG: pantetheine-phosphate adenylyltransferase [Oscillospiraceae bacterium]|nr:pantetheine-phosphate adenylyltransferase [bacterium]MDY5101391.1 pantetheine-phosphate adenylyltransferase [Oscillospiraceae bacterium]